MKQVVEKMIEKDRAMFMVFIDLEKACDNVCRKKLWRVLFDYGVRFGYKVCEAGMHTVALAI